jgi:hypothetical protein
MELRRASLPLLKASYCSRCLIAPDRLAAELHRLLMQARAHNATLGLTGILRFKRGCFIQTLEGPEGAVRPLLKRIATDKRHADMMVYEDEPVRGRQYDQWSMAFVPDADSISTLAGVAADQVVISGTAEDEGAMLSRLDRLCAQSSAAR